jgi:sialate O-acetylesterase
MTVAKYFNSHMVLQRGIPVPVWGTAAPGAKITVRFNGIAVDPPATTGANGKWMTRLPAMDTSNEDNTLTVTDGKKTITYTHVLVGEV